MLMYVFISFQPDGFSLEDFKAMQQAIEKLKKTVRRQNKRIKKIETMIDVVVAGSGEDSGAEDEE